jgi:hypothetical protein
MRNVCLPDGDMAGWPLLLSYGYMIEERIDLGPVRITFIAAHKLATTEQSAVMS